MKTQSKIEALQKKIADLKVQEYLETRIGKFLIDSGFTVNSDESGDIWMYKAVPHDSAAYVHQCGTCYLVDPDGNEHYDQDCEDDYEIMDWVKRIPIINKYTAVYMTKPQEFYSTESKPDYEDSFSSRHGKWVVTKV
jgi:hypothetical protein